MNQNQILQILETGNGGGNGVYESLLQFAYASAKARAVLGKKPVQGTGKGELQYFEKMPGSRDSRNGYGRGWKWRRHWEL